jgi:hypothetical protein
MPLPRHGQMSPAQGDFHLMSHHRPITIEVWSLIFLSLSCFDLGILSQSINSASRVLPYLPRSMSGALHGTEPHVYDSKVI